MNIKPINSKSNAWFPMGAGRALLMLDDRRSFYRGHLGNIQGRNLGGYVVYLALDEPIAIKINGREWKTCEMAVVAPHITHCIRAAKGCAAQVILESEDISAEHLPSWMSSESGVIGDEALIAHWRTACSSIGQSDSSLLTEMLDRLLFGRSLPQRHTDARIGRVVQKILDNPAEQHSAEDCASAVALSCSRFLHLFSHEMGVPFRRFRAWKRARSLLYILKRECNLTDLALDCGYSDSAHFSNSIRDVYGYKPREIVFAGRSIPTFRQAVAHRQSSAFWQ